MDKKKLNETGWKTFVLQNRNVRFSKLRIVTLLLERITEIAMQVMEQGRQGLSTCPKWARKDQCWEVPEQC